MFDEFEFATIELSKIALDKRNPRIVTLQPLKDEAAIISYMFAHEELGAFIAKIVVERKNPGAERPYVIAEGAGFVVIEGNTRIAAYKLLTGLSVAPPAYVHLVPAIDESFASTLLTVDCSIAPSRDAMLPIMAEAHFGLGEKSKWGYLGSRKAVYDEYKAGRKVPQIASIFKKPKGKIRDLILEYMLYLEALKLKWTHEEAAKLADPGVEFNPPVRFLQSEGHLEKVEMAFDRENLKIKFLTAVARKKFQHLVRKLVIERPKGMGATASYAQVFKDFAAADYSPEDAEGEGAGGSEGTSDDTDGGGQSGPDKDPPGGHALKTGALFNYPVKKDSLTLKQLMKEASEINATKLPASATALLRSLLESILKHVIDEQNANPDGKPHSLESAIDRCLQAAINLTADDKKILRDFKKAHLDYVNLGVHGNLVPSASRIFDARNSIDQFVRRNV